MTYKLDDGVVFNTALSIPFDQSSGDTFKLKGLLDLPAYQPLTDRFGFNVGGVLEAQSSEEPFLGDHGPRTK